MKKPEESVVNEASIPWTEQGHGDGYLVRRKRLGAAAGGERIGTSLIELPPGKRSWPLHLHMANEEAIYVLDGTATLRLADREFPLRAGDYVALPAGLTHPHQIVNTSDAPLRYLAISTLIDPEVTLYPDSNKVGVIHGNPGSRTLFEFYPRDGAVDYWKGED